MCSHYIVPNVQVHRSIFNDSVHLSYIPVYHWFKLGRLLIPLHRSRSPSTIINVHGLNRTLQTSNPSFTQWLSHKFASIGFGARLSRNLILIPDVHVLFREMVGFLHSASLLTARLRPLRLGQQY